MVFKMSLLLHWVVLTGIFAYSFGQESTDTDAEFCGRKEEDVNKTCISIRLPWKIEPIYFCTERDNINFTMQSDSQNCWKYTSSEKTLKIATPWEKCPLVSVPDICSSIDCNPPPFNRSCVETPGARNDRWSCCSTYFCDEGSKSSCPMEKLKPGCDTPPRFKDNCVAFEDVHGCCNKYQCEGEGKPGFCPVELKARSLQKYSASGKKMTRKQRKALRSACSASLKTISTEIECVGDYTCPGSMKCCATELTAYLDSPTLSILPLYSAKGRREKPYKGYCVDPMFSKASDLDEFDSLC